MEPSLKRDRSGKSRTLREGISSLAAGLNILKLLALSDSGRIRSARRGPVAKVEGGSFSSLTRFPSRRRLVFRVKRKKRCLQDMQRHGTMWNSFSIASQVPSLRERRITSAPHSGQRRRAVFLGSAGELACAFWSGEGASPPPDIRTLSVRTGMRKFIVLLRRHCRLSPI